MIYFNLNDTVKIIYPYSHHAQFKNKIGRIIPLNNEIFCLWNQYRVDFKELGCELFAPEELEKIHE